MFCVRVSGALVRRDNNALTGVRSVELTYSTLFPVTHRHTQLAVEWGKEIEKRTKGAVKVTMFAGATLSPADQCYNGVKKGISDIGMSVAAYNKGRFPLTEVLKYL